MINDKRLAELERLCEEATPGPWAWTYIGEKVNGYVVGVCCDKDGKELAGHQEFDLYDEESGVFVENIVTAQMIGEHEAATCNYSDPKFIAASRTAIPELLEEVRRLQNDLESYQTASAEYCDGLKADAERYKVVRDIAQMYSPHMGGQHCWHIPISLLNGRGPTFDAAIDSMSKGDSDA